MATIGYNSTTNLSGEERTTSTPHFILSGYGTLTPTVNQTLTKAGFWVPATPAYPAGQIEIGVFRVSNGARVGTVIVSGGNPGASPAAYEANFSGGLTLSAGVEYCVAFRVVADASLMRYDTGASTGDRNSTLNGTNALPATFTTTGEGLTSIWGVYVITADAGGAAVLSSQTPSGTIGTTTQVTLGASTDQNNGTLYAVVSSTQSHITGITDAQVIAGQSSSGGAAQFSGNAAISSTSPTLSISGLTAGTTYYYALAQSNANGNSNVVTGSFTTAVSTRTASITLCDAAGVLLNAITLRFWTRVTRDAVAIDGGATGLSITCNSVGVFTLTGLTIAAGSGWLTVADPSDPLNTHNYPVTFS